MLALSRSRLHDNISIRRAFILHLCHPGVLREVEGDHQGFENAFFEARCVYLDIMWLYVIGQAGPTLVGCGGYAPAHQYGRLVIGRIPGDGFYLHYIISVVE
jgi:hypothetical protein